MKLWFDTEFIEDGKTIDLLSIGVVREDGATYYAEPAEAARSRAGDWVMCNVLPHLGGPVRSRAEIAQQLVEFAGPAPEWWAYFADYDWVALCQLYGTMMDLPDGWPMYCRDVKQLADGYGVSDLHALVQQDTQEHHALEDARWVTRVWHALRALERGPISAFG